MKLKDISNNMSTKDWVTTILMAIGGIMVIVGWFEYSSASAEKANAIAQKKKYEIEMKYKEKYDAADAKIRKLELNIEKHLGNIDTLRGKVTEREGAIDGLSLEINQLRSKTPDIDKISKELEDVTISGLCKRFDSLGYRCKVIVDENM